MAYCSRCGVEVGPGVPACPLCDAPIQRLDEAPPEPARYPVVPAMPGRQVRSLVWAVSTAALMSGSLAPVAMDFVLNGRATWSLYPLTGAGVMWLLITLIVIFARRPIFVIVGQAVATTGFLVAIDLFNGRLDWFTTLALPIVAVVTGGSVLVWLAARLTHRAPALVASAVLLACGAGSLGMDLLISAHFGAAGVSWSLIVLGVVTPLLVFLLYFHWRLARRLAVAGLLDR